METVDMFTKNQYTEVFPDARHSLPREFSKQDKNGVTVMYRWIDIDGENWLLKSQAHGIQSVYEMVLDEYIGSHIFNILGYPAQETRFVKEGNNIAIACKDIFHGRQGAFLEDLMDREEEYIRDNFYQEFSSRKTPGQSNANELSNILIFLTYSPTLKQIDRFMEKFWDISVVDALIGNSDRDLQNLAVIYDPPGKVQLAPVFDNASSFYGALEDGSLTGLRIKTPYYLYNEDGELKPVSHMLLLKLEDKLLKNSLKKNITLIGSKINEIYAMIDNIEDSVCSRKDKGHYKKYLDNNYRELLKL